MRHFIALFVLGTLTWPLLLQAEWIEASSRHFVIYSQDDPQQVRALAERLERFDQAVRNVIRLADPDLAPSTRLTLYFLDGKIGLDRAKTGPTYSGKAGDIAALVNQRKLSGRANNDRILFHEYQSAPRARLAAEVLVKLDAAGAEAALRELSNSTLSGYEIGLNP